MRLKPQYLFVVVTIGLVALYFVVKQHCSAPAIASTPA